MKLESILVESQWPRVKEMIHKLRALYPGAVDGTQYGAHINNSAGVDLYPQISGTKRWRLVKRDKHGITDVKYDTLDGLLKALDAELQALGGAIPYPKAERVKPPPPVKAIELTKLESDADEALLAHLHNTKVRRLTYYRKDVYNIVREVCRQTSATAKTEAGRKAGILMHERQKDMLQELGIKQPRNSFEVAWFTLTSFGPDAHKEKPLAVYDLVRKVLIMQVTDDLTLCYADRDLAAVPKELQRRAVLNHKSGSGISTYKIHIGPTPFTFVLDEHGLHLDLTNHVPTNDVLDLQAVYQ